MARAKSTSSVRAKLGLKKTSMAKGDMGGVRGPGTGGRASHPTASRKPIRFVNKQVMSRHKFHGTAKACEWCGYTTRHSLHS